jgi:hypothetical protein
MTWEDVRTVALALPGVEEGTSYGTPAFKVAGKFLTRLRLEDESLVPLDIPSDERGMLMAAEPATFHITQLDKDYPSVLARLESLHPGSRANFLERRRRHVAPRKLVTAFDATRP